MCVRFAQPKWLNQVKYFAKANNAFTIFLHLWHDRFIVYQFKPVSLFSNRDSKVAKRIPFLSSSSSPVASPSSTTRLDSAERSNRPLQKRERTGQENGCFPFEKLICSNKRSTKFESLYQGQKYLEEENGKMVALQISPKIESLYGLGRQATKL